MYIILFVTVALLLCVYAYSRSESFAAGRSSAIVGWFDKHSAPQYEKYKAHFGDNSSIVDYETALSLRKAGRLNTAALTAILRDTRR